MNVEEKRARRHRKKVMKAAKELRKEQAKQEGMDKKKFLKTFLIALAVFLVVLIPAAFAIDNFLETSPFDSPFGNDDEDLENVKFEVLVDPESPFFAEFSDSERINILLLGVNPPLTDTIMLGSFDPKTKHVDIISIPRDTYYHRDGYDSAAENKINAAYKGSALNMANAVSDILLGIPINYYAVVEYEDIEKIVDEMGGVPMYIEKDMYYKDPYDTSFGPGGLVIDIPAGEQVLDGEDSIKFLRFRSGYVEGDIGRIKAQQVWMTNALSQAIDHGILKVADVAFNEIESNINYKAMISLGTKALGIDAEDITTYMMPNTLQEEPPWYVYPDSEGIETMLREIYSIAPETTTDGAITSDTAIEE